MDYIQSHCAILHTRSHNGVFLRSAMNFGTNCRFPHHFFHIIANCLVSVSGIGTFVCIFFFKYVEHIDDVMRTILHKSNLASGTRLYFAPYHQTFNIIAKEEKFCYYTLHHNTDIVC